MKKKSQNIKKTNKGYFLQQKFLLNAIVITQKHLLPFELYERIKIKIPKIQFAKKIQLT